MKNNKGLVIITIILGVLVVLMGGYIVYDKVLNQNNNSESKENKEKVAKRYMAKGLEFDSVIIYTDKDNKYTNDEKYLYYVAITRAQHKLIVYNQ